MTPERRAELERLMEQFASAIGLHADAWYGPKRHRTEESPWGWEDVLAARAEVLRVHQEEVDNAQRR